MLLSPCLWILYDSSRPSVPLVFFLSFFFFSSSFWLDCLIPSLEIHIEYLGIEMALVALSPFHPPSFSFFFSFFGLLCRWEEGGRDNGTRELHFMFRKYT